MSPSEFEAESQIYVETRKVQHKEMILNGPKLNDLVINAA